MFQEDKIPLSHSVHKEKSNKVAMTIAISIGIVCYFLVYFTNLVLARTLGIKDYGIYTTTMSLFIMFSNFSLFGFDLGLTKFLPEYIAHNDLSRSSGYLRYAIQKTFFVNLALFLLSAVTACVLIYFKHHHGSLISDHHPFLLFIWVIPLLITPMCFIANYVRAVGHGNLSLFMSKGAPALFILLILAGVFLTKSFLDVYDALWIALSAAFLTLFLTIIFSYFKTPLLTLFKTSPTYEGKDWVTSNIQLFLLGFSLIDQTSVTITTAHFFEKTHLGAGLISSILTICALMWVNNSAIKTILGPKISVAISNQDTNTSRLLLFLAILFNLIPISIIYCVICWYGKTLLSHFGDHFSEGYTALLIVGASNAIFAVVTPVIWFVQYSAKLKEVTKVCLILFVGYIVLSILFTHQWGSIGNALGFSLMEFIMSLYFIIICWKNWRSIFEAKK